MMVVEQVSLAEVCGGEVFGVKEEDCVGCLVGFLLRGVVRRCFFIRGVVF